MIMQGFIKGIDAALEEKGLGFISNIIDAVLTILLAWLLMRVIRLVVHRLLIKRGDGRNGMREKRLETAGTLAVSIAKYVVYFVAAVTAIGQLGLTASMTSLLTAAGIGSVIVGIGSQSLVKDIVSGVFMLFEDQYSVGDYITASGVTGTVRSIALRTTTVESYTGEITVIPNGSITSLTNYSRTDTLAVIDVPVSLDADVRGAMALMLDEAQRYHGELGDVAVKKPEIVGATEAKNGAIVLRVTMKVKPLEHWGVQRELTARVAERFRKEGVQLPYTRIALTSTEDGK